MYVYEYIYVCINMYVYTSVGRPEDNRGCHFFGTFHLFLKGFIF